MKGGRAMAGRKLGSPATTRASPTFSGPPRPNRVQNDGPERNPLIDDLFDDLSAHSDSDPMGTLQGESVSNRGSFAEFRGATRRPSTAASNSSRSISNGQSKAAVDVICTTAQHFVHAMRMNELDEYFSPSGGAAPEEALRQQLRKKTPQEVMMVVQVLVELLEDVRKARAQVAPLSGSLAFLEGRERALSASMASTFSTASLMRPPVHETNQVATAYDQQGNKMINCYTIIANLGQGAYGKVKLGVDAGSGQNVAIKIIDKKHLKKKIGGLGAGDQDAALKREIAIMKKVRHRNCVSLYEVIDDPASNKLYLIMDYVPNGPVVRLKPQQFTNVALSTIESGAPLNGEVYNKFLIRCAVRQRADGGNAPLTASELASRPAIFLCKPVSQHICALYLRQLVSGLRYMHKRNLVHHDIKPDNILLGTDHHVFLTDFGVSEILSARSAVEGEAAAAAAAGGGGGKDGKGNDMNDNSLSDSGIDGGNANGGNGGPKLGGGTLLFTSPELFDTGVNQTEVDPYLTDVWALGVTLYCMLTGMTPFFGSSLPEVRKNIVTQTYPWNGMDMFKVPVASEWRVILDGLLEKKPEQRWTLQRLKDYLDQDTFQEKMQHAATDEIAAKSAARATSASAGSPSARQSRLGRLPPPLAVTSPTQVAAGSATSQPHRANSASGAISVLSIGADYGAHNFFSAFDVSQAEMSQATRAAKVEVTARKIVVSGHTRALVHRWVERVRQRLQLRNNGHSSSVSSAFGTTVNTGSIPTVQIIDGGGASKMSFGSVMPPLFSDVPVLSVAGSFHRTNTTAGSHAALPPRYPAARESAAQLAGRPSGTGSSASAAAQEGDFARRMRNIRSESIDAILSIVNLQSTSNAFSHSFSFDSSSESSEVGAERPVPAVTETVAATASLTPAESHLSDAVSNAGSTNSTAHSPGNAMTDTVMWCGAGRTPATVAHSSPSDATLERASSDNTPPPTGSRRTPRGAHHGFLSTELSAVNGSPSSYGRDNKSETSDSARKLREDTPSLIAPSMSPTPNLTDSLPVMALGQPRTGGAGNGDGYPPLQQRLSKSRSPTPVFSSVERVPPVRFAQALTSLVRK